MTLSLLILYVHCMFPTYVLHVPVCASVCVMYVCCIGCAKYVCYCTYLCVVCTVQGDICLL